MEIVSRRVALFAPLAFLVACTAQPEKVTFTLAAHSFRGSEWSAPVNLGAPVNSSAAENNAVLSPDELSLYFISARPGGFGGADIWVAHRVSRDSPWQAPLNLGPSFNTPGLEASPMLSNDGHLLFYSSDRPGGQGSNDIYVARRTDTHDDFAWGPSGPLGPGVNTAGFEAGEFYLQSAEDGSTNLYFVRGPNTVALDIYAVAIDREGATLGPAVPVTELNDTDPAVTDARPSIRQDGREVFFYSNRAGSLGASDLFTAVRRSVHEQWSVPENLGSPLSSVANDIQPFLTHDGRTLLFASNRPGGMGNIDIWMATRTPSGK